MPAPFLCIMKKLIYILFFVLVACSNQESVLTLHEHIYSDGEFNLVKYANARWGVIPSEDSFKQEYMLLDAAEIDFSDILSYISKEFGQPTYDHTTIPKDLINNCLNDAIFFLPGGRSVDVGEEMYLWMTDEYTVRLFTYEGYGDILPPYAVLSVFDMDALTEECEDIVNSMD